MGLYYILFNVTMDAYSTINTIILVIAVIILPYTTGQKQCTQAEIDKCLTYFEGYEYDYSNAIVPTMEEAEFRQHCKRYDKFEECIKEFKPRCSRADILIYDGIEKAYQWMCYDAIDTYLTHRECFMNKDLHKEGDVCNDTLTSSLLNLDPNKPTKFRSDRICQYVNQYLDCVDNVVDSFCGPEAAQWQRTLDIRSLDPLLSAIDCPLEKKTSTWIITVIIILLLISVIIIVVSVVMVIMQKKKKRRAANRNPSPSTTTAAVNAPPPYQPYMVYNPSGEYVNMGQADPIPDKSGFVEPPPYQPTQPNTEPTPAPVYTSLDLTAASASGADDAVAAGYFGVNSDVDTQPQGKSTTKKIESDAPAFEAMP